MRKDKGDTERETNVEKNLGIPDVAVKKRDVVSQRWGKGGKVQRRKGCEERGGATVR